MRHREQVGRALIGCAGHSGMVGYRCDGRRDEGVDVLPQSVS